MKPKQWLYDNGHIADPTQRGRLSKDKIALIEKAVAEGASIDGYTVSKSYKPTDTTGPTKPVQVDKVAIKGDRIADVPDETRPEKSWEAFTMVDGKRQPIGMRTVCNTCANSLTYCYCRTPLVNHGDNTRAMVSFTSRSSPLPARLW